MSDSPSEPLSLASVRQYVKTALRKGYFKESFHAEDEHQERCISTDDVIYGLEIDWAFERPACWKNNRWRYYIETETIDGDKLIVIIVLEPAEHRVEVISRW
jgi:hypothetical protein